MASVSGIIDPTSISFSTIKADLNEYIKSRDDYYKWKTFLESGPGQTEVELLAGFGTMLNFHSIGSRRESSLFTCKLYNTAVALAMNLDYPVNRISSVRIDLTLRLSPTLGPITWNKETPIAYLDGNPISLLNTEILQPGDNLVQAVYLSLIHI